jgi:hypothetical protein
MMNGAYYADRALLESGRLIIDAIAAVLAAAIAGDAAV